MKRFTFKSPSYTRTLLSSYDFKCPSISTSKLFKKFIKKGYEVNRSLDIDTAVEYDGGNDAHIHFVPSFNEAFNHRLTVDIVLGSLDYIEIWSTCKMYSDTGKPFKRELSASVNLATHISISDPSKYDKDLFNLTKGKQLGQDFLDKHDQIEQMLVDHDFQIRMQFEELLSKYSNILNDLVN